MNIKEMIEKHLEHVKKYRSLGTYKWYKKTYKSLNKAFEYLSIYTDKDVLKTIFDDVVAYYLKCTEKKNSKINDMISTMITLFKFNEVNIPRYYKLKNDTVSFTCVDLDDLRIMMNYLKGLDDHVSNNHEWKLAIYLFLETGVRLSELLDIRCYNIDIKRKMIKLLHTKNGYSRIVFFNDLSLKYIKDRVKNKHEYLFSINQRSLEYFFTKMNRDLKLKENITAHRLRKTFATYLLRNQCPLTTISKLLGHRDIRQTMIYLEIDEMQLKNDYMQFYPFNTKED